MLRIGRWIHRWQVARAVDKGFALAADKLKPQLVRVVSSDEPDPSYQARFGSYGPSGKEQAEASHESSLRQAIEQCKRELTALPPSLVFSVVAQVLNKVPRKAESIDSGFYYVEDGDTHCGFVTTSTEEWSLADISSIVSEIRKAVSGCGQRARRA
jgi:hypothetical protein